jgi:hypothetical protein
MTRLTFRSSRFNTTEVKPHFINDCCFGEDVAAWLAPKLAERGYRVLEPGQEDWGWYLEVLRDRVWHFLAIGYGDEWMIHVKRVRGFWGALSGESKATAPELVLAIEEILRAEPEIDEVLREDD